MVADTQRGGRIGRGQPSPYASNDAITTPSTASPSSSQSEIGSESESTKSQFELHSTWLEKNAPEPVRRLVGALYAFYTKAQDMQVIHQKLDRIIEAQHAQATAPRSHRSWAEIAALSSSTSSLPSQYPSLPSASTRLTIRPASDSELKSKEATNKEIVDQIRKTIPGAVAARTLPSGDIRLTLENPTQKERATRAADTIQRELKAKIIREDYPIEVLGVPTTLPVTTGKGADNSTLIREIVQVNSRMITGFDVSRIAWIHGKRSVEPGTNGHVPKSASLIIYVTNEDIQKAALRKGLVIDYDHFTTRLYDPGLQLPLCFRCNHWGHTQANCRARQNCGFCAQSHNTKECPHREDQSKSKCCNCGQHGHATWQRAKCPAYAQRLASRDRLRAALALKEHRWTEEQGQVHPQPQPQPPSSTKRPLAGSSEQNGQRKRPVGRPSLASLHGYPPDASQRSIFQFAGTAGRDAETDVDMGSGTPSSAPRPPTDDEW